MAVIVALCTAMVALQELRRGISAAVGWLAPGLVGALLAAAFPVHAAMPAESCERLFLRACLCTFPCGCSAARAFSSN
ncbi:hypothetical protein [Bradyrhizobium zhanjiangense]|uniref:Uncharacterized protein n=1 Tax=Bradyrhizobium zhanjiangense TaxID=1325107 RepID=A0A4Q0SN38_9BRAD|nr:hypothetical protein [Bradyrhizobium zhanjiangense]RXH41057.1 hypothetical protein XH94_09445 [Bradyrhizobium zhanjiangense]